MAAESRFNIRLRANFLPGLSLLERADPAKPHTRLTNTNIERIQKVGGLFYRIDLRRRIRCASGLPILPTSDADDDFRQRALCGAA